MKRHLSALTAFALAVLALFALPGLRTEAVQARPAQVVERISKAFTTVYLIEGKAGMVLVDTHNAGEEDWILSELDKLGVALTDISLILITHGHPDHAGSAAALAKATGAPIALGAGDLHLVDGSPVTGDIGEQATDWRGRTLGKLLDPSFPSFTPEILVEDRLDLAPWGVEAVARVVGGHTAGSLAVTLPDGQVLSGDLVRGGMFTRHKPTLHFFHEDQARAQAALGELLAKQPTAICSAHDRCLDPDRVERWLERQPAP